MIAGHMQPSFVYLVTHIVQATLNNPTRVETRDATVSGLVTPLVSPAGGKLSLLIDFVIRKKVSGGSMPSVKVTVLMDDAGSSQ